VPSVGSDDAPESAEPASSRLRSFAVAALGTVAVVVLLVGATTAWSIRTAQDSDWVEARVAGILTDPAVSDALAARVVEEVSTSLALESEVAAAVPDELEPVVAVVFAGARGWIEDQLAELIRTEAVAETVAVAIGRAHSVAVDVIRGDDVVDGVRIEDGEVRVNLLPLVTDALRFVQDVGLLRDAEIPELGRDGDPDAQRAELSAALDRPLPEHFGEPVLLRSEAIDELGATVTTARDLLVLARRVVVGVLLVGAVLAGATIWWSQRRWRTAGFLLAGFLVGALVIGRLLDRAGDRLPEAVESPGAKATVRELVASLERSLTGTLFTVGFVGIAAFVVTAVVVARTTPAPATASADTGPPA
jgi:hypothetical protein